MANELKYHARNNNLQIFDVPGDGDCFFHAVSRQLSSSQVPWTLFSGPELRRRLIYFFLTGDTSTYRQQYEDFYNIPFYIYLQRLIDKDWANEFTIRATANMLNITINILAQNGYWHEPINPMEEIGRVVKIGHIYELHYVAFDKIDDNDSPTISETPRRLPNRKRHLASAEQQIYIVKKRARQQPPERFKMHNSGRAVPHQLPNSPYIQENVHFNGSPSNKRKKQRMTQTEKIRAIRAKKTPEAMDLECENNRIRMTVIRASQTEEKAKQCRERNRIMKAATRAAKTQVEREQNCEQVRFRWATSQAAMTDVERDQQRELNCQQQATNRERRQTKGKYKIATKTSKILQGTLYISILSDTDDSIGEMDLECGKCGAMKFKNENFAVCCGDGKVKPPPFPKPPQEINDLWFGNTPDAKLFRANSRSLNNAVCLSSLVVQEKKIKGFSPTVIFQGRVIHQMGPLQAAPGVQPRFAQVYVLDPSLETTTRFANMNLPVGMKPNEKEIMKKLMETVQKAIHQHNPYVHEFKQVLEIPDEDLGEGKIVISATARPQDGHNRVYNVQANLQELSIVTNEEQHDLVIQLRGGGLKIIPDLNPKGMPLHFTLLFINGMHGWHKDREHEDRIKRLTVREFFVFHLNVRNTDSDFIFRAGRLLQEFILNCWVTCESQRLKFLRFNQKNLRADKYINLKDAVNKLRQDSLNHNEQ